MKVLLTFNMFSKPSQMGQNQLFEPTETLTSIEVFQSWVDEHGGPEGSGILSDYTQFTPVINYDTEENPTSLDFQNKDDILGRAWIIMVPDEFTQD